LGATVAVERWGGQVGWGLQARVGGCVNARPDPASECGEGSWKNLSAADQAFASELKTLIEKGVPIKGIQVQVGIPKTGTSGIPQAKFSEWK